MGQDLGVGAAVLAQQSGHVGMPDRVGAGVEAGAGSAALETEIRTPRNADCSVCGTRNS